MWSLHSATIILEFIYWLLPDEFPVYLVMNENLINPSPLKYFQQLLDNVATGSAYFAPTSQPQ